MGSIDDRIRKLEEQFAGPAYGAVDRENILRPELVAFLDRVAAIKHRGAPATDEERADLEAFEGELKAELKRRRAEERYGD